MKKAIIIGIIVLVVLLVLLCATSVYAVTAIEGFNDTLLALLDGYIEYCKAVIEVFGMVL